MKQETETKTFQVRTDLALEERESFEGDGGEISGVMLRERRYPKNKVKLTEVKILNEQGEKAMGKPKGTYLTLEAKNMTGEEAKQQVCEELAGQLRKLVEEHTGKKKKEPLSVLVIGLGNAAVTPDSLGPRVFENLYVTRHLAGQCGEDFLEKQNLSSVSALAPGVMAQTGMETAEILQGMISEIHPDILLAIDALAARSVRRLGTTIQLTDTGIHPGSGVGNHRRGLTKESLGIPVLAIGVPTVVGAAAIVHDTVLALTGVLKNHTFTKETGKWIEEMEPESQYQLIEELLEPEFGSFYVTPPDIDETIGRLSLLISEAIHRAFLPTLFA